MRSTLKPLLIMPAILSCPAISSAQDIRYSLQVKRHERNITMARYCFLCLLAVTLYLGCATVKAQPVACDKKCLATIRGLLQEQERGVSLSWLEKASRQLGDRASVGLQQIFTERNISNPKTVRLFLPILVEAFRDTDMISRPEYKTPTATIKLLTTLKLKVGDSPIREEITKTMDEIIGLTSRNTRNRASSVVLITQKKRNAKRLSHQDEHIAQVINSLDKSNRLRTALENGVRGDGVHYAWMDDMHALRIKQASFTFQFFWDKGMLKVDVSKVNYHQKYYEYDLAINDTRTLKAITSVGLKDKLEVEARTRANMTIQDLLDQLRPTSKACGTIYINLLDDETLPIIDGMPYIDIDSDCNSKDKNYNAGTHSPGLR